jgi:outer membrane protein assembly factor BamB
VLNGFVYINESNGSIAAYRASDGKFSWRVNLGTAVYYTIASDTTIYCFLTKGDYGRVEAFRASDGSFLWQRAPLHGVSAWPPTVLGGIIYVNNPVDGSIQAQTIIGSPALDNGIVYMTAAGGSIFALRASDGMLLWRYPFSPRK